MRKVFSVAMMAAMLSLVGISRDASATATVTLIWGAGSAGTLGLGSGTVTVAPGGGQTLRLDIYLTHSEVSGLGGHAFSLNFDTDLGNELNLLGGAMAPAEWLGTDTNPGPPSDNYGPIGLLPGPEGTVESSGAVAGRVNSYESGTVAATFLPRTGLAYSVGSYTATAPTSYRVATAFFAVNAGALTDGDDVFSGAFNGLADVTANGLNQPVTMSFGNASVNVVPEPGTVSLLGLGLLGLVLAGRRSRRS
jgi:hypothetical protein